MEITPLELSLQEQFKLFSNQTEDIIAGRGQSKGQDIPGDLYEHYSDRRNISTELAWEEVHQTTIDAVLRNMMGRRIAGFVLGHFDRRDIDNLGMTLSDTLKEVGKGDYTEDIRNMIKGYYSRQTK